MNDPAILFVKPQAIGAEGRAALTKAGVVVIEVADPRDVKLVRATADLPGSTLLRLAAETLARNSSDSAREAFGMRVCQALMQENERH